MVRVTATAQCAVGKERARGRATMAGASDPNSDTNNAVCLSCSRRILGGTRRTWRGVVYILCIHILTFGASDALVKVTWVKAVAVQIHC